MPVPIELPLLVVRLAVDGRRWRLPREADLSLRLLNVPLARRLDEPGLPYSCMALPGRYLADLLAHAAQTSWQGPVLILNPTWEPGPDGLRALVAEMADRAGEPESDAGWQLLLNQADQLLAYALPARAPRPDAALQFALRWLSGADAALDVQLLAGLGIAARVCSVRTRDYAAVPRALPVFPEMQGLPRLAAQARVRQQAVGGAQTLAVVTHHAGDVLLTVRALEACGQGITGIVVHRAYQDVARAVHGRLPIIAVGGPLPARAGLSSPAQPLNEDLRYFERVVQPQLPADSAFVLLRPSRGYIDADTTLAAQIAYAVGARGDEAHYPRGVVIRACDAPSTQAPPPALPVVRGRRVLLHLDGGWPLKVYPPRWRAELLGALQAAGFQVSVLDARLEGAPSHRFSDLAALDALLRDHDLLIGMDSFPCHYASQQLGLPTICLFGPTRSINLAHAAPNYLAAEQGLPCVPCSARQICPHFGGNWCRNFVPPARVAELALNCLPPS